MCGRDSGELSARHATAPKEIMRRRGTTQDERFSEEEIMHRRRTTPAGKVFRRCVREIALPMWCPGAAPPHSKFATLGHNLLHDNRCLHIGVIVAMIGK